MNPYLIDQVETGKLLSLEIVVFYTLELDEFWSFVQKKSNQRWTWYAIQRRTGIIVAYHNGKRTDDDYILLLNKMKHLPIKRIYTDDWGAYSRWTPAHIQHVIGKDNTWKIERKNLNFRTHLKRLHRKTICFSKNESIHDNVIGMYINKYYFRYGKYSKSVVA